MSETFFSFSVGDSSKKKTLVVLLSTVIIFILGFFLINNKVFLATEVQRQNAQVAGSSVVLGYTNVNFASINTGSVWRLSDPKDSNGNTVLAFEVAAPFTMTESGNLDSVEVAISRSPVANGSVTSKTISLSTDVGGKPGTVIESWSIVPNTTPTLVKLNSVNPKILF